jgi:two-component system OmpR family response regulator
MEPGRGALARAKVLLVDDEQAVVHALSLAFQEGAGDPDGWEVSIARNVAEALALAARTRFDAVVTDKNLPDGSGLHLARTLREARADLAILVVTGYASSESRRESQAIGVDEYLEKPFTDIYAVPRLTRAVVERRRTAA